MGKTHTNPYDITQDQPKLKKAFEEFKKDFVENNQTLISALKEVNQQQASQLKDYNDVIAVAKDNSKASSESSDLIENFIMGLVYHSRVMISSPCSL